LISLDTIAGKDVSTIASRWVYPGDLVHRTPESVRPCFCIGEVTQWKKDEQKADVRLRYFFTDEKKNESMIFLRDNPQKFKLAILEKGAFILVAEDAREIAEYF